jgi:hypothetical protein
MQSIRRQKKLYKPLSRVWRSEPPMRAMRHVCALYVDLRDSGSDWGRPSQVSRDESRKLLNDAANEYAGQWDRIRPDLLRATGDPRLADALEAWRERPELPAPAWFE